MKDQASIHMHTCGSLQCFDSPRAAPSRPPGTPRTSPASNNRPLHHPSPSHTGIKQLAPRHPAFAALPIRGCSAGGACTGLQRPQRSTQPVQPPSRHWRTPHPPSDRKSRSDVSPHEKVSARRPVRCDCALCAGRGLQLASSGRRTYRGCLVGLGVIWTALFPEPFRWVEFLDA